MNRKYNIAMAALAVYTAFFTAGCGKNELPQMPEMTVSGTSASKTEKINAVHDIDPMAAEHGADGLPFSMPMKTANVLLYPQRTRFALTADISATMTYAG